MSQLQIEILKVMHRTGQCGINELEHKCCLHSQPRQLRQDLGELIIDGLVEQVRDPQGHILGYRCTEIGARSAESLRFAS